MDYRFHNKFHEKNHHTDSTSGYPDSGRDPIASQDRPFRGDFYLDGSLSGSGDITLTDGSSADMTYLDSPSGDIILTSDLDLNSYTILNLKLETISGFDITEPSYGNLLVYNSTTSLWENSEVLPVDSVGYEQIDSTIWGDGLSGDGTTVSLEYATPAEAIEGTDNKKIITPYAIPSASETVEGVVELATQEEVLVGTDTDRAITPLTLKKSNTVDGTPYYQCKGTTISKSTLTKPSEFIDDVLTVEFNEYSYGGFQHFGSNMYAVKSFLYSMNLNVSTPTTITMYRFWQLHTNMFIYANGVLLKQLGHLGNTKAGDKVEFTLPQGDNVLFQIVTNNPYSTDTLNALYVVGDVVGGNVTFIPPELL